MTDFETVTVHRRGGAATIELNRPEALNAWNTQFGLDLLAAVDEAAADDDVRAVLITGAGRAFSSGADLKAGLRPDAGGPPRRPHRADRALPPDHHRHPRDAQAGHRRGQRPRGRHRLLARAACDLVVAGESAYFLLAFVNIGLVPDGGSSLFVPARTGFGRAMEMAMLGERVARRAGAELGPGQPGRPGRRARARRRTSSSTASPPARPAPTRARSASSTPGSTPAWTSSSRWKPTSSRRWPDRPTSPRASWHSCRSAQPGSAAGDRRVNRARTSRRDRPSPDYHHAPLCARLSASAPAGAPSHWRSCSPSPASWRWPPAPPPTSGAPRTAAPRTRTRSTTCTGCSSSSGAIVFVGVEGALLYSLFKFRARKGAVPAQIRGNTRLEIGWTVGAALILVVIAVVTFTQLGDIRNAPESEPGRPARCRRQRLPARHRHADRRAPSRKSGKSLRIRVNGQQYVWRYTYPDGDDNALNNAFSYEEMVVPADTTVTLEITAQDVAHSWWIPELGGKMDADPRPHELHVVQDPRRQGRHPLPRPVRRALRPQPRRTWSPTSARSRRRSSRRTWSRASARSTPPTEDAAKQRKAARGRRRGR